MNRFVWTAIALATLALTASCTPMDPASDTYAELHGSPGSSGGTGGGGAGVGGAGGSDTADTGAAGVFPPEWACLQNPVTPPPRPADAGPTATFIVPVVDFLVQPAMLQAVQGLTVTACDSGIPDCPAPVEAVKVINPAPPPLPPFFIAVVAPYGWERLTLRLKAPGYITTDYILGGRLIGSPEGGPTARGLPIPLLTTDALQNIYNALRLGKVDLNRGIMAIRTLNCLRDTSSAVLPPQGTRAANVLLEGQPAPTDPPSRAWSLAFSNLARPNVLTTDARGVAGFANVDPGPYTVRGVAPVGGGTPYGLITLAVQPGIITIAEIRDGIDVWGQ